MELPLKNDDFLLRNGRLFCNLRYAHQRSSSFVRSRRLGMGRPSLGESHEAKHDRKIVHVECPEILLDGDVRAGVIRHGSTAVKPRAGAAACEAYCELQYKC